MTFSQSSITEVATMGIKSISRIVSFNGDGLTYGDAFSFIDDNKLYRVIDFINDTAIAYVEFGDAIEKDGEWCRDYSKIAYFKAYDNDQHVVNYGGIKIC